MVKHHTYHTKPRTVSPTGKACSDDAFDDGSAGVARVQCTIDASLANELLVQFEAMNDFYFYSLYAQYYLLNDFHCNLLRTDPKAPVIVDHLKEYLDSVYSWGRFELVLFTNCLFVFDDKYISFQYHESVESMWLAVNSSNHANDLLAFLINGSQLTFERHDKAVFQEFFLVNWLRLREPTMT
nr:hypothetical protein [Lacticaseibacillus manihotivorans]